MLYTIAIDALGYEFDGAFYKNLTPDTIIFVSYDYNNVEDAKKSLNRIDPNDFRKISGKDVYTLTLSLLDSETNEISRRQIYFGDEAEWCGYAVPFEDGGYIED